MDLSLFIFYEGGTRDPGTSCCYTLSLFLTPFYVLCCISDAQKKDDKDNDDNNDSDDDDSEDEVMAKDGSPGTSFDFGSRQPLICPETPENAGPKVSGTN